jgi:hypothetical protein
VRQLIDEIPVPDATTAWVALNTIEENFRDALEEHRLLRGGRPGGLRHISRGLNQLRREGSA